MSAFPSSRPLRFEYWRSTLDGQWYWHLKVSGDEKVAQGEAYATKSACLAAIALVKDAREAPAENLSPAEK